MQVKIQYVVKIIENPGSLTLEVVGMEGINHTSYLNDEMSALEFVKMKFLRFIRRAIDSGNFINIPQADTTKSPATHLVVTLSDIDSMRIRAYQLIQNPRGMGLSNYARRVGMDTADLQNLLTLGTTQSSLSHVELAQIKEIFAHHGKRLSIELNDIPQDELHRILD